MLCFLLLWERGASASNRRYKEHFSLWLLRSGDRLFPLQKTVLVTSSPKDLFPQSCSGFTDLRFVPTPHFLCSASLRALSLSGVIVLDFLSLTRIRALRDYCTVFFFFFPLVAFWRFSVLDHSRALPVCSNYAAAAFWFFFFFWARDAPASSSCNTDDGGFNPLLLFCVLLQNYLACLIFSPSSLDVSLVSSCSSESLWQQKAVFNLVWQKEGFDDAPFCEEYQASCLVLFSFPVT